MLARIVRTPVEKSSRSHLRAHSLAAAGAGHHRQPDEHAPVGIPPGSGRDPRGLLGRRRLRIRRLLGRLPRRGCRVHADPLPLDRAVARALQDPVDLPDRRGGHRLADVLAAQVVAPLVARRPVLDEPPAIAPHRARPQLQVERFDRLGLQPAQRQLTEHGADVVADVALAGDARRRLDVEDRHVAIEHLPGGRPRTRVPALVDLREEARAGSSRPPSRPWAQVHRLVKVETALRDRVDPRVDLHPGSHRSAAPRSLPGPSAGVSCWQTWSGRSRPRTEIDPGCGRRGGPLCR
jgi:hypothetical protein